MKKWIGWGIVVGLVVLLGFWAVSRLLTNAHADQPAEESVKATQVITIKQETMQEKLMDPSVDLPGRESLMEKIEIQKRLDENEKAGQASPASKEGETNPGPAAMMASSQVETGIFEGSEGLIRPEQAKIQNYWRGVMDGKIFMVMAGSSSTDNDQGLVVLVSASLDPSDSAVNFEYFATPEKSGSLRVVDEKENRVTLQTPGGTKFLFDIKSKTFIQ